jgi:hypothetical protein
MGTGLVVQDHQRVNPRLGQGLNVPLVKAQGVLVGPAAWGRVLEGEAHHFHAERAQLCRDRISLRISKVDVESIHSAIS